MHNMRFQRPNKSFSVPFKKYKWENAMRFLMLTLIIVLLIFILKITQNPNF